MNRENENPAVHSLLERRTEEVMSFGKNLVRFRKQKGLTQADLVKRCGVGISQIRRYEADRSQPTLEVIARVARVLGVSADDLVFDEGKGVASVRIVDRELLAQFEALSDLDAIDREAIKRVIAAVIARSQVERAMQAAPKAAVAGRR